MAKEINTIGVLYKWWRCTGNERDYSCSSSSGSFKRKKSKRNQERICRTLKMKKS